MHTSQGGAGAGILFLLQERGGLIMLNSIAAEYMDSPYVSIHGETPLFRGRPLSLDLDRCKPP
jgi:hypothetical protein